MTHYVELSPKLINWRLPDPDTMNSKREKFASADVASTRTETLSIHFHLRDGSERVLPLGALPYEHVQNLKAYVADRFEASAHYDLSRAV